MSSLIGLGRNDNEDHTETSTSNITRYNADLQKICNWFDTIGDPFSFEDSRLRSLWTDVTASDTDNITCDIAGEVGLKINQKMDGIV